MGILDEYADVFDSELLQQTSAYYHTIELTTYRPVNTRPYTLSPQKQEFVKKQVEEMLAHNLIEPSTSLYNPPIVVVEYADSSREPRFCIDYRKLNAITVDQHCPASSIHEIVKNLGSSQVFCKIDLKKGYWQIPLAGEAKTYTAFTTTNGSHYQFKVMPFGLKNAPATFIQLMNKVLTGLLGSFFIYLFIKCLFV
ncbi:hypothetical protein M8J76_007008 [Diaphorina citri]|nr:hypothetical protein M8J76_007008 [Diaphorina citri]